MITATIVEINSDANGNISVVTDYKDENDVLVQRGMTRYSYSVSETQKDIEDRIKKDIDDHCNNLIVRIHFKNKNVSSINNLKSSIMGYTSSKETGDVKRGDKVLTVSETKIVSAKDSV